MQCRPSIEPGFTGLGLGLFQLYQLKTFVLSFQINLKFIGRKNILVDLQIQVTIIKK